MNKEAVWSNCIIICLAIIMIAGGTSMPSHNGFLAVSILSLLLLARCILHFCYYGMDLRMRTALAIVGAGIALMVLHLIPLPPVVWNNLGGRETVVGLFQNLGEQDRWLPLSLSPTSTLQNIVALLPGLAAFVSVQILPNKYWPWIGAMIIGVALANIFAALIQARTGTDQIGHGFFVNQNFYAAQIYGALAFVIYAAMDFSEKSNWIWILVSLVVALLVAAIGATGSRLGLGLAALVIGISAFAALKHSSISKRQLSAAGAFLALAAIVVFFGGVSLERIAALQNAADFRANIFSVSLQGLNAFFPFGSGFGSFVPVYQMFETPQLLQPEYINHAHNDWLELLIEGGLPMLGLMLAFMWWLSKATLQTWKHPAGLHLAQAASITIAALLIHSAFDYPLRNASLMTLFGVCCGLLAKQGTVQQSSLFGSSVTEEDLNLMALHRHEGAVQ